MHLLDLCIVDRVDSLSLFFDEYGDIVTQGEEGTDHVRHCAAFRSEKASNGGVDVREVLIAHGDGSSRDDVSHDPAHRVQGCKPDALF